MARDEIEIIPRAGTPLPCPGCARLRAERDEAMSEAMERTTFWRLAHGEAQKEKINLLRCLDAGASVLLLAKRFAKEATERNRRDFMDAIKRHEQRLDALERRSALEGGPEDGA